MFDLLINYSFIQLHKNVYKIFKNKILKEKNDRYYFKIINIHLLDALKLQYFQIQST